MNSLHYMDYCSFLERNHCSWINNNNNNNNNNKLVRGSLDFCRGSRVLCRGSRVEGRGYHVESIEKIKTHVKLRKLHT